MNNEHNKITKSKIANSKSKEKKIYPNINSNEINGNKKHSIDITKILSNSVSQNYNHITNEEEIYHSIFNLNAENINNDLIYNSQAIVSKKVKRSTITKGSLAEKSLNKLGDNNFYSEDTIHRICTPYKTKFKYPQTQKAKKVINLQKKQDDRFKSIISNSDIVRKNFGNKNLKKYINNVEPYKHEKSIYLMSEVF